MYLGRLASQALERGVRVGRAGKGVIYVWASGNGGSRYINVSLCHNLEPPHIRVDAHCYRSPTQINNATLEYDMVKDLKIKKGLIYKIYNLKRR